VEVRLHFPHQQESLHEVMALDPHLDQQQQQQPEPIHEMNTAVGQTLLRRYENIKTWNCPDFNIPVRALLQLTV
jgi:hypothetical protein